MPTTKITGLTGLNVRALRESLATDNEPVTITSTTATFAMPTGQAIDYMQTLMERVGSTHGTRGHPYASLHAVMRKLRRAAREG